MSSPAGSTRKARTSRGSPVSAAQLGAILDLIAEGTISGKIAKDVFEIVWNEGGDPRAIVEAARLEAGDRPFGASKSSSTTSSPKNPDKVADAKTNPKAIGWFVGQVMKASGGKANPQAVNDLLKKRSASERTVLPPRRTQERRAALFCARRDASENFARDDA